MTGDFSNAEPIGLIHGLAKQMQTHKTHEIREANILIKNNDRIITINAYL